MFLLNVTYYENIKLGAPTDLLEKLPFLLFYHLLCGMPAITLLRNTLKGSFINKLELPLPFERIINIQTQGNVFRFYSLYNICARDVKSAHTHTWSVSFVDVKYFGLWGEGRRDW